MKKLLSIMLALALSASLLAGCGNTTETKKEETKKEEPTKTEEKQEEKKEEAKPEVKEVELNVAYMPNYGSLWSVQNTIAQGFLAEQGIKVNLVEFQDGPTIIAAMESGSSSEDILVNTLTLAGMKMEDIQAVDMDPSAIVTAMLSGGVDACATWSPNTIKILDELKDATKLTDNVTFSDQTVSLASWIVTPTYAEKNRDLVLRFTKALFKAMDYAANDHQQETSGLIAKQVNHRSCLRTKRRCKMAYR